VIVRFPDVPDVDGPLTLPRPAVFLLGSYSRETGAIGVWYEEAARYLDRHVGCVFYGVIVGEFREDFIRWYFHWLDRCDLAVAWLDAGDSIRPMLSWSQFELGYVMGTRARTGEPDLLVGVHPGHVNLRLSIELVADHLGLQLRIHDNLQSMLQVARDVARRVR
jgi:hypothetical protein